LRFLPINSMSQQFATVRVLFQWVTKAVGNSVRHDCDKRLTKTNGSAGLTGRSSGVMFCARPHHSAKCPTPSGFTSALIGAIMDSYAPAQALPGSNPGAPKPPAGGVVTLGFGRTLPWIGRTMTC
jgi:hypothetical protein